MTSVVDWCILSRTADADSAKLHWDDNQVGCHALSEDYELSGTAASSTSVPRCRHHNNKTSVNKANFVENGGTSSLSIHIYTHNQKEKTSILIANYINVI